MTTYSLIPMDHPSFLSLAADADGLENWAGAWRTRLAHIHTAGRCVPSTIMCVWRKSCSRNIHIPNEYVKPNLSFVYHILKSFSDVKKVGLDPNSQHVFTTKHTHAGIIPVSSDVRDCIGIPFFKDGNTLKSKLSCLLHQSNKLAYSG